MLAPSKALLGFLCLVCTFFLYTHDHFSASPSDYVASPSTTLGAINVDPQPSRPQTALCSSSNTCSAPAHSVDETERTSAVPKEKRPRILQATMMFGNTYIGLNERTLQSHIDHAERWGYRDHTLRREIVGAGRWDKFIFSKILLVLELIMGELKKPKDEQAEWVVWYDADTLILNPNIQWELFLPPAAFANINFMATKNVDGVNAGLFFFRVDEWSVEFLSDTYSLGRLRPEIDISGNIEQNSMKYLLSQDQVKKHIIYQPQSWYNGFHGDGRADTEINEGDMLVHFAGINHDDEEGRKNELMSEWFAKIEKEPEKWQVPLEKTKYPKAIEAFWKTYEKSKGILDSVHVRPDSQSGPDQAVKWARDELKWAVEELAYDATWLKKCTEDMAQALTTAERTQVVERPTGGQGGESGGHAKQQALTDAKEPEQPAVGGQGHSSDSQEQLAAGTDGKVETPRISSQRFKGPPME